MKVKLDDIHIGERLRTVNEEAVAAIAASFKSEGQLQPILVARLAKSVKGAKWKLVAGAHRMAAAASVGWSQISADELDLTGLSQDMAAIHIDIAECVENMHRSNISATDALAFTKRLVDRTHQREMLKKKEAAEKEAAEIKERERAEQRRLQEIKRKTDAEEAEIKRQAEEAERARLATKAAREKVERAIDAFEASRGNLADTVGQNAPRLTGRKAAANLAAKEIPILKTSSRTLVEYDNLARKLGEDVVKKLKGTPLDNHSELRALARLFDLDPDAARQCVKEAAELGYQKCSATGRLGGIMARQKQAAKEKDDAENAHNPLRHYQLLKDALLKARSALIEADGIHKMKSQVKGRFNEIATAKRIIDDCLHRATQGIAAHKGDPT